MREILYIQAGSLANYTGTHFWNTQDAYFTYGPDESDEPFVWHDISFREGLDGKGNPTYCPRVLIFDRRASFGTLSQANSLTGVVEHESEDELTESSHQWNGLVERHEQLPIEQSRYHQELEKEDGEPESTDSAGRAVNPSHGDVIAHDIRYWSDFSRVFYIPRSIQYIPDVCDWETTELDWKEGQKLYNQFAQDHELMDSTVRPFLEECDSIQGIQLINDCASFGPFTASFLTAFRDDMVKLPTLALPILSNIVSRDFEVGKNLETRRVINDALYLRSIAELTALNVLLKHPTLWEQERWPFSLNNNSVFHSSAVLSANIETATLPLRLKGTNMDISSFAAQLNWRGTNSFTELSGMFPASPETNLFNFTQGAWEHHPIPTPFARQNVSRGFTVPMIKQFEDTSSALNSGYSLYENSIHTRVYPLPTSFPSLLPPADTGARTQETTMLSSIKSTEGVAAIFTDYINGIEGCLRNSGALQADKDDIDELKDLLNDLWTMHDNYASTPDEVESLERSEDED